MEEIYTADVFVNMETGAREVVRRNIGAKTSERFFPNETLAAIGLIVEEEDLIAMNVAADELRLLIERIERLEEDKRAVMEDIKNVYSEAKSRGFDPKIMRQIIKLRAMESHERQEWEAVLDTYIAALGM
jgi:uncharacterized protein (UPF0335 family)